MDTHYLVNDDLIVRAESIVAVRRSQNVQSLTVWITHHAEPVELVYDSESARDAAYDWFKAELLDKSS